MKNWSRVIPIAEFKIDRVVCCDGKRLLIIVARKCIAEYFTPQSGIRNI